MKDKISNIKKSCKETRILLILILVIMFGGLIFTSVYLVMGLVQAKDSYELEVRQDDFGQEESHLVINGKDFGVVDSEEYNRISIENGETNYKACFVINGMIGLVEIVIIMAIFLIIVRMMSDIAKDFRPFTKRNIRRLRIISVLVMVFAILPGLTKLTLTFFVFLAASSSITGIDILVVAIGIAIWGISTVFEYGSAVQEEIDSIA